MALSPLKGAKKGTRVTRPGSDDSDGGDEGDESEDGSGSSGDAANAPTARQPARIPEGDVLGVIAGQVNVFTKPSDGSKRLGYLRLGTVVPREAEATKSAGCEHGKWYKIKPKGYVCADKRKTTFNRDNAILQAALVVQPDLRAAMPYKYGFVRAVLPLYLKVPSRKQQLKSEFKLKEHLEKYEKLGGDEKMNAVIPGAYDVPIDKRGIPLLGGKVGKVPNPTKRWGQGVLFGGNGDDDPIPAWLKPKRSIPNLADFKVPDYAVFADRARRHTGLSFVGSFATESAGMKRRFAITTDLRLAPTTKVKPDTGSPWHGIEIRDPKRSPPMPFAWVRTTTVKGYKINGDGEETSVGKLPKRAIVMLSGKSRRTRRSDYWELSNGYYIRKKDAAAVQSPETWPKAAKRGVKWIEVSIKNQTLVLWEGKKPVYATMVSSGRDKLGDPKTTLSTVRGTFRIRDKHITATMDSNGNRGSGHSLAPRAPARHGPSKYALAEPPEASPGPDFFAPQPAHAPSLFEGWPSGKSNHWLQRPPQLTGSTRLTGLELFSGARGAKKRKESKHSRDRRRKINAKKGRSSEYGVTRRRGEGTFWLRDVPYVQYFEKGYALHVSYWHDVFGIARSHGCINLSPVDGKVIFNWTEPQVPAGWHGIDLRSGDLGKGTVIWVHE